MIATQSKGREKQCGGMFLRAFGLGAFAVASALLTALPLRADTSYSGASVNSDDSVSSWGVTEACSMASHITHMSSTLTSPKGRQASGNASGGCETEVDLYLAFESTDTGTYTVVSYSWAFCPVLGRWFWNGNESEGSTNNAYPTNFTQGGSEIDADGELYFLYQWQSSSGNPADIASCSVGEFVTYPGYQPGQNNIYWWPSPPWQPTKTNNPTKDWVAGNNSSCKQGNLNGVAPCVIDNQRHSSFVSPPTLGSQNSFEADQNWWYQCPEAWDGITMDLTASTAIDRSVTQSGSTYTHKVVKSGATASCTLGQTCSGL